MLGALGDGADGWFKIQLRSMNIYFFSGVHSAKTGNRMRSVGYAKLAAKSNRRHAGVMVGDFENMRVGDGAQ